MPVSVRRLLGQSTSHCHGSRSSIYPVPPVTLFDLRFYLPTSVHIAMAWFWRGFQSAVFYYVSCAPCTKLAHQRKRQKEAQRSKASNALNASEDPGLYNHPSPFSTNTYWREEIILGPGPPPKKERRTGNRRDLNGVGQGSSNGSSADTTVVGGTSEEVLAGVEGRISGEGWNRRRYQREDELLWGVDGADEDPGRLSGVSRTGTTSSGGNYSIARNPAVNDLHPPVVSTRPTHRSETKWMLQPPPSAKVMEGKQRANRSRSGSGGSNGSSRRNPDAMSLGRQIGERFVEEKVKRGQRPPTADSAPLVKTKSKDWGAMNGSIEGGGQRHDRDPHLSSDSRASSTSSIRRNRPQAITISEDKSRIHLATTSPPDLQLPQRPPLSTIASSSAVIPSTSQPSRPELIASRSTTNVLTRALTSDYLPSSHALQELLPPSSTLNTLPESRIRLPSATKVEDRDLQLPECETWFPVRDFRFPSTEGSEGGRLPQQRWSMEI